MRRALRALLAAALAVALALGLRYGAQILYTAVAEWRAGVGFSLWPRAFPLLSTGPLSPWLVGGLLPAIGIAAAAVAGAGRSPWLRGFAAVTGLVCAAFAGSLAVVQPQAWPIVAGLSVSATAGAVIALGRLPRAGWAATVLAGGALLFVGRGALIDTWQDLTQRHPPFVLELQAAYPTQKGVYIIAPGAENVVVDGVTWEIARGDVLRLSEKDVGVVRRSGTTIVIHVTDGDKALALARRSAKRISQHDALVLNGRVVAVPLYNAMLADGWVALDLPGRADEVWRELAPP